MPNMPFPAVTVCNANPFRIDRLNETLLAYIQRHGINVTEDNRGSLVVSILVDLFNRNESDQYLNIGFQLSDMLIECSYNHINCSSYFVHSFSSAFLHSYTFNWKATIKKLFTLADVGSGISPFEGLSMTFYVPRHLNFPMVKYDDGIVVSIHDNDELPFIAKNGIRLRPGLAHWITYRKSQTIFLPKPYTNCTSSVGRDLRLVYETIFESKAIHQIAYSEPVCRALCEQAFIFSKCSCIIPVPFFIRHVFTLEHDQPVFANFCSPFSSKERCAFIARQEFLRNPALIAAWCFRCPPQCTHTHFSTQISDLSAPTPAEKAMLAEVLLNNTLNLALPTDFHETFDEYMNANYLRMTITCGSEYVTINRQEPKLSIVDTFSAIGGQTGL